MLRSSTHGLLRCVLQLALQWARVTFNIAAARTDPGPSWPTHRSSFELGLQGLQAATSRRSGL